jgi:hypothetical protein
MQYLAPAFLLLVFGVYSYALHKLSRQMGRDDIERRDVDPEPRDSAVVKQLRSRRW